MTASEFTVFIRKLFVQFPSLYEWLGKSSPDPEGTQALWRDTLKNCTLAECEAVLARWQADGQLPFAAYERDQVATIIRSVVSRNRDKIRKRQRVAEETAQRRDAKRRGTVGEAGFSFGGDLGCASAMAELTPAYKAWKLDLMDRPEYEERETEILDRHIDGKPQRIIDGKWDGTLPEETNVS